MVAYCQYPADLYNADFSNMLNTVPVLAAMTCLHRTRLTKGILKVSSHIAEPSVLGPLCREIDIYTLAVHTRALSSGCLHSLYLFAEGWYSLKKIPNKPIVRNLQSHSLEQ